MHFELVQPLQYMTTTAMKEVSAEDNIGKMTFFTISPNRTFWVLWPRKVGYLTHQFVNKITIIYSRYLLDINYFLLSVVGIK